MAGNCVHCEAPLRKASRFCGTCGEPKLEAKIDPIELAKAKKRKRLILSCVLSLLLTGLVSVFFIRAAIPRGATVTQEISATKVWEGDEIRVISKISFQIQPDHDPFVEIVAHSKSGLEVLDKEYLNPEGVIEVQIAAKYSAMIKTLVIDQKGKSIGQSRPERLEVQTAFLPNHCVLPKARSKEGNSISFTRNRLWDWGYGAYDEDNNPPFDGSVGCGDSSDGLPPTFGSYFVSYEPYAPDSQALSELTQETEWQNQSIWFPEVVIGGTSLNASSLTGGEDYLSNNVFDLKAYFHGIWVEMWVPEDLDESLKLFDEALANIPVQVIDAVPKRPATPDLSWYQIRNLG